MAQPAPIQINMPPSMPQRDFRFDGGAGSYIGILIGSALLIVCTLGIASPWAICMRYRWRSQHTIING